MRYSYSTEICCAKQIEFDVENGVVKNIVFYGGCDGNLKMISKLLEGWTLDQIIDETLSAVSSERTSRVIDHEAAGSMERRKREGYF